MVRVFGVSLLLAVGQVTQPPADLCGGDRQSRRERHCEVREEVVTGQAALDVDPGRNGSVHVRGWSRQNVRLRTRVEGFADDSKRARELATAVRVTTTAGRLRADGPMTFGRDDQWTASFHLDVPANTGLAINTHNGGISIEEFRGSAILRARNGGITLRDVGGDLKGHTQNGGLRIELGGVRWEGRGLDLETTNGSVRFAVPVNYSAELETGTVHGRVTIDFPVTIQSGQQRRYTATLGSGGAKIRAVTTNGSVVIRRE